MGIKKLTPSKSSGGIDPSAGKSMGGRKWGVRDRLRFEDKGKCRGGGGTEGIAPERLRLVVGRSVTGDTPEEGRNAEKEGETEEKDGAIGAQQEVASGRGKNRVNKETGEHYKRVRIRELSSLQQQILSGERYNRRPEKVEKKDRGTF